MAGLIGPHHAKFQMVYLAVFSFLLFSSFPFPSHAGGGTTKRKPKRDVGMAPKEDGRRERKRKRESQSRSQAKYLLKKKPGDHGHYQSLSLSSFKKLFFSEGQTQRAKISVKVAGPFNCQADTDFFLTCPSLRLSIKAST